MAKLAAMIAECEELRAFHRDQRSSGVKGAGIEGAAVAIREKALRDAWNALIESGIRP